MKKSIYLITTIAIMFAFIAQSCDRSSDKMERAQTDVIEAERDISIAQAEIEADVRIYRREIATDIRENNVAIADIKRKIQDEDPETRAAHEVRIEDLERTNSDLKRRIDNYSVTNRNSWDTFKEDFSSSMDDLGNSLDNFFSRTSTTTTSRN
jgi:DNA-binding transcriptional MerR regulator